MDIHEAARRLDGGEYGREGSKELFAEMKAAGLVAVFGASDDLCEFRGAIDDEPSDWPIRLTPAGILKSKCREAGDDCPYFKPIAERTVSIRPVWCGGGAFSWRYETTIPHAKFSIYEDGEPYCEGIVFALADVPEPSHA